ncbi:MAG: hypothetical protein ACD_75C01734G0001 [uncultured bacterium]|nr:MAG: hypothetical protein ACD_75C01734G0001 [uncultured bacterium]
MGLAAEKNHAVAAVAGEFLFHRASFRSVANDDKSDAGIGRVQIFGCPGQIDYAVLIDQPSGDDGHDLLCADPEVLPDGPPFVVVADKFCRIDPVGDKPLRRPDGEGDAEQFPAGGEEEINLAEMSFQYCHPPPAALLDAFQVAGGMVGIGQRNMVDIVPFERAHAVDMDDVRLQPGQQFPHETSQLQAVDESQIFQRYPINLPAVRRRSFRFARAPPGYHRHPVAGLCQCSGQLVHMGRNAAGNRRVIDGNHQNIHIISRFGAGACRR